MRKYGVCLEDNRMRDWRYFTTSITGTRSIFGDEVEVFCHHRL